MRLGCWLVLMTPNAKRLMHESPCKRDRPSAGRGAPRTRRRSSCTENRHPSASWIIVKDGRAIGETWNRDLAAKIDAAGSDRVRAVPVIEWLHSLSVAQAAESPNR
jgi:hypothetical protein